MQAIAEPEVDDRTTTSDQENGRNNLYSFNTETPKPENKQDNSTYTTKKLSITILNRSSRETRTFGPKGHATGARKCKATRIGGKAKCPTNGESGSLGRRTKNIDPKSDLNKFG